MATIAVFLAIGGGGFAFAALKKNSVGSKQIAPDAVKEQEIAPGAVGTDELVDSGITAPKLAQGAVTAAKLGNLVVRTKDAPLPDGTNASATATCQPGERLISGGGRVLSANVDVNLQASHPNATVDGESPTGWTAFGSNAPGGAGATTLVALAVCAQ